MAKFRFRLRFVAVTILSLMAFGVKGATISSETALDRAQLWMDGNPVMSVASVRPVSSVVIFPDAGGYSVYVISFSPTGYLVLNSDDRLPLVVSFSADSAVDLADDPQNAFRAMLLRHVDRMEEVLLQPVSIPMEKSTETEPLAETELYGPFLKTTWNQCNPYNKLCPDDPGGSEYYGYRIPTGCTPTAYAQVLQYHRWPLYGQGSHSYTDASGSTTGEHSVVLADAYDWSSMLEVYDAYTWNGEDAEDAVAELMYELGVAAEANYESSGTSSSISTLGQRLGEYFYFEPYGYQSSQSSLITPMESDLRAGYPCVVSIPGHAIVADGLMVDGGATTYHINYGWGGSNNGWWSADGVPGGALQYGVTSLRPRLIAFPQTNSVTASAGDPVELNWILPKRREAEVQEMNIYQLELQAGTWSYDASEITSGNNAGWGVVSGGRSGDCWYAGPNGPASMVLDEVFVPDASALLTFWMSYRLGTATFTVSVSADDGLSYDELYTANSNYSLDWNQHSVSLSAYAGQKIRLRFALSSGSYYSGSGGVWLDDLAISSGVYSSWQLFAEDDTPASRRFSEVTTEWDECSGFSQFELTSTSTYKDWVVNTTSGVANCFYKEPGGYGNREYHLTSHSTILPTASTRLALHAKYNLASDQFRVSVSTDRNTFTEVWSTSSTVDWGDTTIDLASYAGQAIYVRLEYVTGSYYSNGGIWIDSISMQEVMNPELEGQPVYYTVLTNLTSGTHTLAAKLIDTNAVEHGLAPAFSLTVEGAFDDGDGMPSAWEELYGLNPAIDDGDLDPDLDGYSNYEEYICGTVPTNAASCWMLEPGSSALPSFHAMASRLYTIQYRTNLLDGTWIPLVVDIQGTSNNVAVSNYDSATNSARFYRVQVRLQD